MKNKLFILGWDNALVSDIVENKVHPAYLAMLAEVDPNLHARWTLDDTVSMQGEQPEKAFANCWVTRKAAGHGRFFTRPIVVCRCRR